MCVEGTLPGARPARKMAVCACWGGGGGGRLQAAPRWGVPPVHSFLWFDRSVAQTDKAARAALEAGEASAQAGEEAVGGEAFADAVRTLSSAPVLARLILAECKAEPPPALHAAACVLHDLCYTLFAEGGGAQEATARLCMEWWQAGSPGADRLVPSTLVYLVQHALCSGAARREGLIEGGRGGGGGVGGLCRGHASPGPAGIEVVGRRSMVLRLLACGPVPSDPPAAPGRGGPGGRGRVQSRAAAHASTAGTVAAVKRCSAMRGGLALLDWGDEESISYFKQLLAHALCAPAFLRCAEGRRFLAQLFALHPGFVVQLTAVLKNQIASSRASSACVGRWGCRLCVWGRRIGGRLGATAPAAATDVVRV